MFNFSSHAGQPPGYSRRRMLQSVSAGFGFMAFAGLSTLQQQASAGRSGGLLQDEGNPLAPKSPHFPGKAKHVIFLSMQGAPSHVDTFDYKPALARDAGKAGRSNRGGGKLMQSPFQFSQHGKSGLWISEVFPELAKQADHLCLLRGMHADSPNHPTAQTLMHTGNFQFVRPSLGAWTLYGLGTENSSLPGFVSLNPPAGNSSSYRSAFLPAVFQGTKIATRGGRGNNRNRRGGDEGAGLPDVGNPNLTNAQQRKQLDFIQSLNEQQKQQHPNHPGIDGVIESYELAFRMQDSMPALMDLSDESAETLKLYGADAGPSANFGKQCLLARRFVEAGVRFIEVSQGGWDHHNNIQTQLANSCQQIDQPIAALIQDLHQRGLLEETLVVWGGEFGRTPTTRNGSGRDHNNRGFSTWMAGGGVKGGFSYGETDEHGTEAVEQKMGTHDWHATMLHLLGLDHTRLTYRYAGRDFRLTDVAGEVATDIIA